MSALSTDFEAKIAALSEPPVAAATTGGEKQIRRRRLQLSCGECKKKKLSCDRTWPCQRCLRSGRQQQCSFETPTGRPPVPYTTLAQRQEERQQRATDDETRQLRAEVARLRDLLSRSSTSGEIGRNINSSCGTALPTSLMPSLLVRHNEEQSSSLGSVLSVSTVKSPEHPINRTPRGYYAQHSLFKFFVEIPQLFPFIAEIAEDWLKPAGVYLKKAKSMRSDEWNTRTSTQEQGMFLDALIPSKVDTDALVKFYLNHFEYLHRVVHVPTFKRQYANFWSPEKPRHPATVALILSLIAISASASGGSLDDNLVGAKHRSASLSWILACEEWLRQQSSKHRKLSYYQISCLVYLAKRMNMVHKKRFWAETGCLVQSAIIDGLHCENSSTKVSPYMIEMRRRIWHVIRELEIQNSNEYGLPTLLHNIDSDVAAPTNIDDEQFDEASTAIPSDKPISHYTRTSYQVLSASSWSLRLEISRRLFSPAFSQPLTYDDVLHYTHDITQATVDLEAWDSDPAMRDNHNPGRLLGLTSAILQFQLKKCILNLHRPYLQHNDSKFWLSENICFQMSRDILLLNCQLVDSGVQSLGQLREDLLLASLSITRITLMQLPCSTSIITASSDSTINLLEQCLPIMEDRYLRCFNSEPWCFITMCATSMLLGVHLGKECRQTAKYSCAQKFLALHQKRYGTEQVPFTDQWQQQPAPHDAVSGDGEALEAYQQPTLQDMALTTASEWPDSHVFGSALDSFDFDIDVDSMWEDMWGPQ